MKKVKLLFLYVIFVMISGCSPSNKEFVAFDDFFVSIPLWIIYIVTLVLIFGALTTGFQYAQYRKRKNEGKEETSLGPVVSGLMGLLAFILAFTFGLANNRYNERKDLMLQEVNAIETAYYQTSLLPDEIGAQIRKELRDYTQIRLQVFEGSSNTKTIIKQAEDKKKLIWEKIINLSQVQLKNPVLFSIMMGSVNNMFNLHTKRVTVGLVYHLPAILWIALYLLVIFTMLGVGYTVGQGSKTNRLMVIFFALGFSSIILLIADLDHGGQNKNNAGFIRLNSRPMHDLMNRMNANP